MMINNTSKKKGFSLVEICIGCLIIMALLVPIFTMLSKGNTGTLHNRNEILARVYASNIISFLNLIPYNNANFADGTTFNNEEIKTAFGMVLNAQNKTIDLEEKIDKAFLNLITDKEVDIKEIKIDDWSSKYKIVTVTIKWKEQGKTTEDFIKVTGMVPER